MGDSSRVEVESSAVRTEIASANTQASIVLGAAAIAAGPLVGGAGVFSRRWVIMIPTFAGAAAAAAAVWLLLSVVLPRLDRSGLGAS